MNLRKDGFLSAFYQLPDGQRCALGQNLCNFPEGTTQFFHGWREVKTVGFVRLKTGVVDESSHIEEAIWEYLGESSSSFNVELLLALLDDGWPYQDAVIFCSQSCEACMNVMAWHQGLSWGYAKDSEDFKKCGTSCRFCAPPERSRYHTEQVGEKLKIIEDIFVDKKGWTIPEGITNTPIFEDRT